jgi:hypothetical protein
MTHANPSGATTKSRLSQISLLLHIRKTGMLVAAIMRDERVHPFRKIAFVGILGSLLAMILFPEVLGDIATSFIPVLNAIGLPIEIPTEAGLDWMFFAVAAFNLLRLFPVEIVGEHYDRLFRR